MYAPTRAHMCTHVHMCVHLNVPTNTHAHPQPPTPTSIHPPTHMYPPAFTHSHPQPPIHPPTHINTGTKNRPVRTHVRTYVHTCAHNCTHVHTRANVCTEMYVFACSQTQPHAPTTNHPPTPTHPRTHAHPHPHPCPHPSLKRWSLTSYRHAPLFKILCFLRMWERTPYQDAAWLKRTYVLWFLFACSWRHQHPPTPIHTHPHRPTKPTTHTDPLHSLFSPFPVPSHVPRSAPPASPSHALSPRPPPLRTHACPPPSSSIPHRLSPSRYVRTH